jgi:KDO2-lipid IV(A) lauroyltransferase
MLNLFSRLPLPLLYAFFGVVAWIARLVGWRRALVDDGLGRCLPDLDAGARRGLAREFYASLGCLVAEVVHGAHISREQVKDRVRLENPELVREALQVGRRVLILAGHHCNWEWLLLHLSTAFDEPLVAAYKPASRERADRALIALRSRFGATMLPAKELLLHLVGQRGRVKLAAMVADQSPSARSKRQKWLSFFGQDTAFFEGPGWIAAKLGFWPVFVAMRPDGRGRYVARFEPLAAVDAQPDSEQVLRAYVSALERQIRAYPAQYFWAYNRWKRPKRVHD